jgi:hypothetical protein
VIAYFRAHTAIKELQAFNDAGLFAILYSDKSPVPDEDQRKEDFRRQVLYFLSDLKHTNVTFNPGKTGSKERYFDKHPAGYRY